MRELTEEQLDLISGGNGGEQSSNGSSIADNSGYSLLTVGGAATRPSSTLGLYQPSSAIIHAIADSQTPPNQGGHTDPVFDIELTGDGQTPPEETGNTDSTVDMDMTGESQDTGSDSTTGGSEGEDTEEAAPVSVSDDDPENISIVVEEGATISDLTALVDTLDWPSTDDKQALNNVVNKIGSLSSTDSIASQFNLTSYALNTLENPVTNAANVIEQVLNSETPSLIISNLSATFNAAFGAYILEDDLFFYADDVRAESLIHLAEAVAEDVSIVEGNNGNFAVNSVLNVLLTSGYEPPEVQRSAFESAQWKVRSAEFDAVTENPGLWDSETREAFSAAIDTVLNQGFTDRNITDGDPVKFVEASMVAGFFIEAIISVDAADRASTLRELSTVIEQFDNQGSAALDSYVLSVINTYLENPNSPDYAGFLASIVHVNTDFDPMLRGLSSDTNLFDDGIA